MENNTTQPAAPNKIAQGDNISANQDASRGRPVFTHADVPPQFAPPAYDPLAGRSLPPMQTTPLPMGVPASYTPPSQTRQFPQSPPFVQYPQQTFTQQYPQQFTPKYAQSDVPVAAPYTPPPARPVNRTPAPSAEYFTVPAAHPAGKAPAAPSASPFTSPPAKTAPGVQAAADSSEMFTAPTVNLPSPAPAATPSPPVSAAQPESRPAEKKKQGMSAPAIIAVCALISLLFSLAGNLILWSKLSRPVYTGTTVVTAGQEDFWAGIVERALPCSASIFVSDEYSAWSGSGVVISPDGYILTCDHVAGDPDITSMAVTLYGSEQTYYASLVATDTKNDVALIRIEMTGLAYMKIGNSDMVKAGDRVIGMGNPLGTLPDSVAEGIVSHPSRDALVDGREGKQLLFQTSVPISPGSSGGALINSRGELIGLNNAIDLIIYEGFTVGANLSYAVPVNYALDLIESSVPDLVIPKEPAPGFTAALLDRAAARELGCEEEGVYVTEVAEYMGAWFAGIRVNDRVTRLQDSPVSSPGDISLALENLAVGETVTIEVERDNHFYVFTLTLMRSYPEEP